MDNTNNHQKEPQDSVRNNDQNLQSQNQPRDKVPEDNISYHTKQKTEEDENKIIIDEENQKIKSESIQEAVKEKSKQILNFSNELDNILASINTTWENYREGFSNYYQSDIIPKINEYLNYPCITVLQEKIILIFKFFCKYYFSRVNCLKEVPINELTQMISIILNMNYNCFSLTPNCGEIHDYDLIDDRYFYQIFKELLPDKEVENYYGHNNKNCMYKYFVEFLFQCGYMDSFIDNVLTRDDINPFLYTHLAYYPLYILNFCEKDFLIKKNYNLRIIKYYNSKIDYFISEKSPYIKNEGELYNSAKFIVDSFSKCLFGIFNHVLDEMKQSNPEECQIYAITVFKLGEFFLKQQKINMRMAGIQLCSQLCDEYIKFFSNYENYKKEFNDIDKIYSYATNCAVLYLNKINIFNLIFGENIHEGLIQRSYPTLSFLYRNKSFTSEQIQNLWNISKIKYQSISDSIITLFGQLLPEFTNEDCNIILNIVANMKFEEVNETTLKLLENFCIGKERRELLLNILFKFSNELSFEKGLAKNIIIKSREILVKLLFNFNYKDDLIKYIKHCIFNVNHFYLVNTYSSALSEIFDQFDRFKNNDLRNIYKKYDNKIEDFGMMISYLDDNYKLFPIFMNYLVNIIKMFNFFYEITSGIVNQIDNGIFNHDQILDINNLYGHYKKYIKENINFYYNLNNENIDDENSMDIDFEVSSNSAFNSDNKQKEDIVINESEYDNYIKNTLKDFVLFFQTMISNNILPSNEEIKKSIFEKLSIFFDKMNYNNCIRNILKTIYINHIRANIHFKLSYLNFLYKVGQNTQNINPSIEWYYNLLSDLFSSQINSNNNLHLLTDENLEFLLKEHIMKTDFSILPVSAFTIVNLFSIYANQKKDNATYSPLIQKYTQIKDLKKFEGFNYIWDFCLLTKNESIYQKALNVLMNVLELTSQNIENRNYFINRIFTFIEQNKVNYKNNQGVKIAFIRNLKLISVVNGTKVTKSIFDIKNGNDSIDIIIKNFYFSSQINDNNDKKIKISKDIKVKDLKEYLINTIICSENNLKIYNQKIISNNNAIINGQNNLVDNIEEDNNNISTTSEQNVNALKSTLSSIEDLKKEVYKSNILINYKNKVLQDEYTLADYNLENDSNLVILKGSGYIEEEYKPTEEELKAGYETIRLVFGENLYFNEEVMKASIIKHKGNSEEAALYLTESENVTNLQKEIEKKKKGVEQKDDEIVCLEEDKINLLIEILSNNTDEEMSNNIWQLLSEIKYPESIIRKIIGEELESILKENNLTKLILFLKLINSLVFDDNFCKFNKIGKDQKNKWISTFIKNENIIKSIFMTLFSIHEKIPDHNKINQIINIFIN